VVPVATSQVPSNGWLVEVMVGGLHVTTPRQLLFAAAVEDAESAVQAVRSHIGGLHCTLEAKCRLAPRALAQLGVTTGTVAAL
jgi:hypothetical protein